MLPQSDRHDQCFILHNHLKKKEFIMSKYLVGFVIVFSFSASCSLAQQQYSGNSVMRCDNSDETGPSPDFLYTCYIEKPSCQAFLFFRTQPPFLSVSSIANLTSSNPLELARINNISSSTVLNPGSDVIIPVTCFCSGKYYQANTSYVSGHDDTYFIIANMTYQGLTTCNALMRENPYGELDLHPGMKFQVPLRCACPTQKQIENGTSFLLTYLVTWHDTISQISKWFDVSARTVAIANGFSDEDPVLKPFTTILIPLSKEPLNSQTRSYHPKAISYPAVPQQKQKRSYRRIYIGIGTVAALAVICFVLFLGHFFYRKRRANNTSGKIRQKQKKQKLPEHFLDKVVGIGEI